MRPNGFVRASMLDNIRLPSDAEASRPKNPRCYAQGDMYVCD
jgi:hypothetical protein